VKFLPGDGRNCRTVLVLLIACAVSMGCSPSKAKVAAENAVVKFHAQLDNEQYHDIYSHASPEFQKSGSEADLTEFLAAVHRKLGKLQRSDEQGVYINYNTSGSTIRLGYRSEFANGSATEQFVWQAGDPSSLISYRIDSRALVTK